jgi:hypothetical protein
MSTPAKSTRAVIRRELRELNTHEKALRKGLDTAIKDARIILKGTDLALIQTAKFRQKCNAAAQRELVKAEKLFNKATASIRQRRAILEGRLG